MLITAAAGRAWQFSHSLGRPTNEHNGKTGGYRFPVDLVVAPDDILFVLSRGLGYQQDFGRIGKTTLDEEHLGDFARKEFTWPAGIAMSQDSRLFVTDEWEHHVAIFPSDVLYPYPGIQRGRRAHWAVGRGRLGAGPAQSPQRHRDRRRRQRVRGRHRQRPGAEVHEGRRLHPGLGRFGKRAGPVRPALGHDHRPRGLRVRRRLGQQPSPEVQRRRRVRALLRGYGRGRRRPESPSERRGGQRGRRVCDRPGATSASRSTSPKAT